MVVLQCLCLTSLLTDNLDRESKAGPCNSFLNFILILQAFFILLGASVPRLMGDAFGVR